MITHVGREAFRAAEEFLNTRFFKRRNTAHRIDQQRLEMFKTARNFVKAEIFRNPIHSPRAGVGFKRANEQFARVVFVISAVIIVAKHR